MKQNRGLIHKINRAFIVQGLFISVAALLSVFFAKVVLEETLIKEAIKQEADYFWERYQSNDTFPLPDTQNLTGYFDIEELPVDIKTRLPLTQGFHESTEQHIVVYKTRQGDNDLYLLYYRDQVDSLAMYYGLFPLTLILIFLYATLWFSYRFSRRMVSPVSWLANQVNRIDFSAKQISSINLEEIPFETDDEIQLLANSINHLGERLDNFIERERNFTRDASHEMRTPLTVIRIATDMLQGEKKSSDLATKSLQKIKRAVDDMEDLTEAFLLLARESDSALSIESVNINDIVHEEIERAEPFNRIKNIPVSITEHHELNINASDKVLSVLLGNLIRNAILYTESGTIDITITDNSVIIEDSGIGMSKEEVDKIFMPHYRAKSDINIGHGVGLTIVKRLSERFHWPLKVRSTPQKGTRIEIFFKSPG
ncbi:MAG: HAMP domain-containing sensor histidine kinase [Gammaproteobacteria bacterium]|nr:HAMP domain-containing sensor histidine kinase [Gammaproteobacteria bacterium]